MLRPDKEVARQAQTLLNQVARVDGPGAAILLARGNTVVFRKARGMADLEFKVPLSSEHVFRIASITKTFTAALVLKLAEEKRISLDHLVSAHLPGLGEVGGATIRQILSHTAGIPDQATVGPRGSDPAARIAEIRSRPLKFLPGTSWSYSNSGYILLGALIEKVTGERWYAAMQTHLFEPNRLAHTQYGDLSVVIPGRAKGYTTSSPTGPVRNADYVPAAVPDAAGALVSTVDDLFLWFRALASGRVISKQAFHQMIAPHPASFDDPYGLGVYVWNVRSETVIGHTGQIPGFASVALYLPQRDITIIALGNDDSFDARQFGRRLAAVAVGRPYAEPVAIVPSIGELHSLEGRYGTNDKSTARTFIVRDGVLYAKRDSGSTLPLQDDL